MLREKQVKTVLNKLKKRDSWFLADYTANPYEGCSCNCQYCYIRGSKYGENLAEGLAVKANALEVLEEQLIVKSQKGQYGLVVLGSATDAYIHQEEQYRMAEGMLKLFLKYRFPVFISTKCTLVRRDIGLLKEIDKAAILPADLQPTLKRGVIFSVSVSTLDEKVSRTLEPGAATPLQRLQLLQEMKQEGFLAGVNAIPLLPFISDTEEELDKIIFAAKEHDADYILTGGLTLFGDQAADSKTLFYKFLERYDASLLPKYRQLYDHGYYTDPMYQKKLKDRAGKICERYSIRNSILG
ncbi:MAG: radical SAM protein [Chitinophagaceae bacterium]|nr:radical SAM protein [Chitinophagaceae bacterium]